MIPHITEEQYMAISRKKLLTLYKMNHEIDEVNAEAYYAAQAEANAPAPRKPITPDMVTDEMVNIYLHTPTEWLANRHKNTMAAAVNAYLGAKK